MHKKIIFILFLLLIIPQNSYAQKKPVTDYNTKISYINMDWWKGFEDSCLNEYIFKAILYNKDLQISTLKVEESIENKNIKRASEMPSISAGAVPALYKLPGLTNSDDLISLPIFANYELDLFGKNRDRTKSMDKLIEISRQNERTNYISVSSAVGSTYYNIVKLDKIIELQKQIIKDRKAIYDLMKLSNEEGLVSTADTVNANKAYIKSNSDLTEYQKNRARLLNMLAVLIGESPENTDNFVRIAFEDLKLNKQIPDSISSDKIENRPDYLSSLKMLEKTGLDIRAAKKDFLPVFNIFGLLSFNSTEYLSRMNWTNSVSLLAGSALLPIFTGGRKIANLKLQKNKYNQAFENYKKTYLTSLQEVNDSLYDLKSDNDKFYKTLESYDVEKQDFYYTDLKYKEGIISNLDLLQKKENLYITEQRLTKEKIDLFIDHISLYKAVAGDLT